MPKRNAGGDLNADNWDIEDEQEDPGRFQTAEVTKLQSRVIKTARRRTINSEESNSTGSLFKSFTGFGNTAGSNSFQFGASASTKASTGASNPLPMFNFGTTGSNNTPSSFQFGNTSSSVGIVTSDASHPATNRSRHLKHLKSLNASVMKWIRDHIDKDPYCILSPVFVDYDRHLSEIEKKYPFIEEDDSPPVITQIKPSNGTTSFETSRNQDKAIFMNDSQQTTQPLFKFGALSSSSTTTTTVSNSNSLFQFTAVTSGGRSYSTNLASSSTDGGKPFRFSSTTSTASSGVLTSTSSSDSGKARFSFGSLPTSDKAPPIVEAAATKPVFSFGQLTPSKSDTVKPATTTASAPTFSFGASNAKPAFSFGTMSSSSSSSSIFQAASSSAAANDADDDDEYVPPKAEVKEIKEAGSVYSTRCKLFQKTGSEWKEKGVGNVYIKPIDAGKFQLLMRADTSLGFILLNIMVSKELPFKQSKNNITFVCVPVPENKTPVPMLLRVKTEEAAIELLNKINDNR